RAGLAAQVVQLHGWQLQGVVFVEGHDLGVNGAAGKEQFANNQFRL
ncbi:MAG: hypothetical protein GWN13_12120, partial [Phycisphaerae bacterium]|nr:hypothetical protein [Phycisphaerae bacterium]NIW98965.1 hypothetical protein [Phycisphaerae bacterium]